MSKSDEFEVALVTLAPVHIQIVYGSNDAGVVAKHLIPSLRRATRSPFTIWCLNFHDRSTPFQVADDIDIRWIDRTGEEPSGFGANHNHLFRTRGTTEDFVIVNPDCVLLPGSIDRLLDKKASNPNAAIVEGRQWPFEHPKEYDPRTFETPWASGAFAFIDGVFFANSGGFDESFFMYLEDVDLSWRAWCAGLEVLHEPEAVACHFSGGAFYRSDLRSSEEYLGSRNFLLLARKFFGPAGERRAMNIVRRTFSGPIADRIIDDYRTRFQGRASRDEKYPAHRQVKILGFNRFHEIRS